MKKIELLLQEMVIWSPSESLQKLQDIIESRIIKSFQIGRRCIGTKMKWVGKEKVSVPEYKKTRYVIEFADGLKLNVESKVFNHYRKKRKVVYFNWYD